MAAIVQILLSLMCVVFADERYADAGRTELPIWQKKPLFSNDLYSFDPSSPALFKNHVIHTRNSKETYDRYESYLERINQFNHQSNIPSQSVDLPSIQDRFNSPDNISQNKSTNNGDNTGSENKKENGKKHKNVFTSHTENFEEEIFDTNEDKGMVSPRSDSDTKVIIDSKKDNEVDINGNNVYISYQNVPGTVAGSNNQQSGNNAVHMDVTANGNNLQPSNNQYYHVSNPQSPVNNVYISIAVNMPSGGVPLKNQPNANKEQNMPITQNNIQATNWNNQAGNREQISTNIPLNRFTSNDYNNDIINPVHNNLPFNIYNPTYIWIYANGQVILIPGFAINLQENGNQRPNIPVSQNPNNENIQNGYSSKTYQTPNTVAPINNEPKTGSGKQNLQPVPNASGNNNLGFYYTPDQYGQPVVSNINNQRPTVNNQNHSPAGTNNNQKIQPGGAWPATNNGNGYQQPSPTPAKESSAVFHLDGITTTDGETQFTKPVQKPPVAVNDAGRHYDNKGYLSQMVETYPAVMISDNNKIDNTKEKIEDEE